LLVRLERALVKVWRSVKRLISTGSLLKTTTARTQSCLCFQQPRFLEILIFQQLCHGWNLT